MHFLTLVVFAPQILPHRPSSVDEGPESEGGEGSDGGGGDCQVKTSNVNYCTSGISAIHSFLILKEIRGNTKNDLDLTLYVDCHVFKKAHSSPLFNRGLTAESLQPQLVDPREFRSREIMGQSADRLAKHFGVSR